MTDVTIKPCPFCGHAPVLRQIPNDGRWEIGCHTVTCICPKVEWARSKEVCLAIWNQREGQGEAVKPMQVLLPPAAGVNDEYLAGWCEGQAYLILNYGDDAAFEKAVADTERYTHPAPPAADEAMVEKVAQALAKNIAEQDGEEWEPKPDWDMKWAYIDQGEVDFAEVARAAIAAMEASRG